MAAPLLYVALADGLELSSAIASWPFPRGGVAPLRPDAASTLALLAAGSIEIAPQNSVDTTTPPDIVRGQPGIHRSVAN